MAALAGAAVVVAVWAITSGDDRGDLNGDVRLSFGPGHPEDKALLRKPLEQAIKRINDEIDLPKDLSVRAVNERDAARHQVSGPQYIADDRTVYFPYSFVDHSREDIKRFGHPSLPDKTSDEVVRDAMLFVLYHEVTHGLIDTLNLPSVGGEEANADSLAAVFAIASGQKRQGQAAPLSASALDEAEGKRKGPPGLADYADDHKLGQQRAVDALCLVYGSDPKRYRNLVGAKEGLSPKRAEVCEYEYPREVLSWRRLLGDYLTERGGLRPPGN